VYVLPNTGVGLSLPATWQVVDLTSNPEKALEAATRSPELIAQLNPVVVQLREAGSRFFAFDPTTPLGNFQPPQFPALAYVIRSDPAPADLDAFVAGLAPEPPGRELVDLRRMTGAVGNNLSGEYGRPAFDPISRLR
jgi:hypothetical protein